jgi:hypothetical protein
LICTVLKIPEHPQIKRIEQTEAPAPKKPRKSFTMEEFCDKSILDLIKRDVPETVSPGKRSRSRGIFPYTPSLSEIAAKFRRKQGGPMETYAKIVKDIVTEKQEDLTPSSLERQRSFVKELFFNDTEHLTQIKRKPVEPERRWENKDFVDLTGEGSSGKPVPRKAQEIEPENPNKFEEEIIVTMMNPPIQKRLGIPMKRTSMNLNQTTNTNEQPKPPKNPAKYGKTFQEFQMFNDEFKSSKVGRTTKIWTSLKSRNPKEDSQPVPKIDANKDDDDYQERLKHVEICRQKIDGKNYDVDSYLNDFLRAQFSDKFY